MLQPPSAGMNASPSRCSSGPENRIGMRDEPESVSTSATSASCTFFASIVTMPSSPFTSTFTPCRRSRSETTCTSRISGTFLSTDVPGASRAATMALLTKFFAPRTLIVPLSGLPPTTCSTSSVFSTSTSFKLFQAHDSRFLNASNSSRARFISAPPRYRPRAQFPTILPHTM